MAVAVAVVGSLDSIVAIMWQSRYFLKRSRVGPSVVLPGEAGEAGEGNPETGERRLGGGILVLLQLLQGTEMGP